jgi:putative salt-induced outer membrane protein YdiY
MTLYRSALALAISLAATGAAHAQATVKPDGQWRAVLGLGASLSSGNTDAKNFALNTDAVRATAQDKTSLYGSAQYAKSGGTTTGEQIRLGGRYDHNLSADLFAFGGLDLERNKFSNFKLHGLGSAGLGWHVIKSADTTLDVFGGLGYTSDKYFSAMVIDGTNRSSFSYANLVLGEESTHKLSESTSFKQKLVVVPNLRQSGAWRANWDAGLSVAMSKTMNLNVGMALAHNSDPGAGRKATDTLLTTGVSVKFD